MPCTLTPPKVNICLEFVLHHMLGIENGLLPSWVLTYLFHAIWGAIVNAANIYLKSRTRASLEQPFTKHFIKCLDIPGKRQSPFDRELLKSCYLKYGNPFFLSVFSATSALRGSGKRGHSCLRFWQNTQAKQPSPPPDTHTQYTQQGYVSVRK